MKNLALLTVLVLIGVTSAIPQFFGTRRNGFQQSIEDENDTDEELEEEKRPYSFAWTASRHYNGDPDREHKEERGADGVTRGVFRYVDPSNNVQEVVYISDDSGFHVDASNIPQDTPVVLAAKLRHQALYEQIKREHARIGEEQSRDSDEDDIDSREK